MSNFENIPQNPITMDPLQRFLDGQRFGYETALKEMQSGQKLSHWIWYVFPQIKGLGHSPNAQFYAISDKKEAFEYLAHPILGPRLRVITQAILSHKGEDIYTIMGSDIDAIKLRSSMTLFDAISPDDVFAQVIDLFFDGERDCRTLDIIED